MLHLLKKVYLTSDRIIDVNLDRVVISKEYGFDTLESISANGGELIAKGFAVQDVVGEEKGFTDLTDLFDALAKHCNNSGKKVIIYADDESFIEIIAYFYKLIFKNIDKANCKLLTENMLTKFYMFQQARFITSNTPMSSFKIDTSSFETAFDSATVVKRSEFINTYLKDLSVEALLATYLNNGQAKEELKSSVKVLLAKDLEKYLYELKEIFLIHFLNKKFTDHLSLEKDYNWANLQDFLNDSSKFGELFFNERIWNSKIMYTPSSGKNIKVDAITTADIENFKEFTTIAGSVWNDESVYSNVKSDVSKLDFLGIYTDFTDELLDKLIETESTFEHAAGSFFSIDLETVNHYFITSLLNAKQNDDTEFLNKYSIL